MGVGNRQRGDDGAGPRLIDARNPAARGVWLDAGAAPENYLETIAGTNPDTILFVDAVAFGGISGECRLIDARNGLSEPVERSVRKLAAFLSNVLNRSQSNGGGDADLKSRSW